MAAPMDSSTENEVPRSRCLNALTLPNMRNIAGEDILSELVNDYFVVTMDLAE